MQRERLILTDRLWIQFSAKGGEALLSAAAQAGVRLSNVRCQAGNCTACIKGNEWQHLHTIAQKGGWKMEVIARRGPGRLLKRIRNRPGVLAGIALFVCLLQILQGYVWTIDFSGLEPAQIETYRALLSEQGIWEGAQLTGEKLQKARQALAQQLNEQGWVGLNFINGRLVIEQTEREQQSIRQQAAPGALYAKASGQVVAITLQGGFSAIELGQYVAQGQLLVNGQKLDREGKAVVQGAQGRVMARVEKTYTAVQPTTTYKDLLTGQAETSSQWHLLGYTGTLGRQKQQTPAAGSDAKTTWYPLQLGQIALPGSVSHTTRWLHKRQRIVYTAQTAAALAQRRCRLQLLADFPDATVLEQVGTAEQTEEGIVYTARYVFTADIAAAGDLAPLTVPEEP